MPRLAPHAILLPESPIRKLAPYADAAKKAGTAVYHLNIGQPDIPTPSLFFDAIRDADLKVLEYSPSAGTHELRREIVEYYDRIGQTISTDQILVTCGASEGLNFVFGSILEANDEVIVPEPFYANYLSFCMQNRGQVVPVTSNIDDEFALPPIEAMEKKITDRTRAIMICNPANPTGTLYPAEAMESLRKLVKKYDLFLICDEVYREFIYDGDPPVSGLSLADVEDNVILIDSISKRFSACGARIGCVISRNTQLMATMLKMAQARLSPPTLGQIGATAVYSLPTRFFEEVRVEYRGRRDLVHQLLNQMPGVFCPAIAGAFYAMARLPVDDTDVFCQWMLESFQHKGATVMMAPGSGFYVTPGLGKQEVRIAYVLNKESLTQAMECVAAGLAEYTKLNA